MSYILDALKKAESERKLGAVPTIHAQPAVAAVPLAPSSPWSKPWLWGDVTTLALALAGIAGFKSWTAPAVTAPAATVENTPAIAAAPAVTHPPAATEMPVPPPIPPAPKAEPEAPKRPTEHTTPKKTATTPAALADEPMPALRELPETVRREIPALAVSGYLYADKPADRSVLINNKLLREGDEVAPGLMLERMQKNGMVLRYKGYRFRTSY